MNPSAFDFLDHCLGLGSLEAEPEMGNHVQVILGGVLSGEFCGRVKEVGEADEGAEQKDGGSYEVHSLIPWGALQCKPYFRICPTMRQGSGILCPCNGRPLTLGTFYMTP